MNASALWVVLALSASAGSESLSPEQLREASAILDSTWSPFCPGRTLSSCTSGRAAEWRADVRAMVGEGLDREAILARLEARRPDFDLRAVPEASALRMGPWVLGGVFLAILLALVAWAGRHRVAPGPASRPPDDAEARRLRAELEAMES
ncbi:MAG: cytochrome c-type biogenesis protein CcmH [Myxococcota bacterium]